MSEKKRSTGKKVIGEIHLQVLATKATPAPPIGPMLASKGLNIMEFCKAFNAQTQGMPADKPIRVVITAYADKSFTFVLGEAPVTYWLKQKGQLNQKKGSSTPGRGTDAGTITISQLREIAQIKKNDMNTEDEEAVLRMLIGSSRSMGLKVIEGE